MEELVKKIQVAILQGKTEMYINAIPVKLPARQKTGAITQCVTYAELQARELLKNNPSLM